MARPDAYDNLLKIGSLKPAIRDRSSIDQYLGLADEALADVGRVASVSSKFTLAYEAMFDVVMAVLEHRETRPGDSQGHRASSIDVAAADLGLDSIKRAVLTRMHTLRNRVTYRNPIPPVTRSDAAAMETLLKEMLPLARRLVAD